MATTRKKKSSKGRAATEARRKKRPKESAARARMRKLKEDLERDDRRGGGGGDDDTIQFEPGANYVRILPAVDPEEPFYVEYDLHFDCGPGNEALRCIEPGGAINMSSSKDKRKAAKKCPRCKQYVAQILKSRKYPRGDETGLALWKEAQNDMRGKRRYVMNAQLPKSDDPDAVKKLKCGVKIMQPLMVYFFDEDECGDFTDPTTGRAMIVDRTGEKREDIEYSVRASMKKKRVRNWAKLAEQCFDLEEAAGELLSVADFKKAMEGVELEDDDIDEDDIDEDDIDEDDDDTDDDDEYEDDDDDDEDDDDEDDDDDDEDEDDDDEEEDDDDDDEEEEEEERPRRRKKKSTSTRSKLKSRARRRRDR